MSDNDLFQLYSQRILTLAAAIPHLGPLLDADARAERRAPLCGSTVAVEVKIEAGRIKGFGQTVRACALGQASAAIFGAQAVGCTLPQVRAARDQLAAMLAGGAVPDAPFAEYAVLQAARDYRNRHQSILLVAEATLAAFESVAP